MMKNLCFEKDIKHKQKKKTFLPSLLSRSILHPATTTRTLTAVYFSAPRHNIQVNDNKSVLSFSADQLDYRVRHATNNQFNQSRHLAVATELSCYDTVGIFIIVLLVFIRGRRKKERERERGKAINRIWKQAKGTYNYRCADVISRHVAVKAILGLARRHPELRLHRRSTGLCMIDWICRRQPQRLSCSVQC